MVLMPEGNHRQECSFARECRPRIKCPDNAHEKFDMPVVLRYKGFRFFFYSNEGSPREPVHVHVMGAGGEAKFWILPNVALAESNGFDARTLKELLDVVTNNSELIERTWNEYFC
jgi:hypothetical protein